MTRELILVALCGACGTAHAAEPSRLGVQLMVDAGTPRLIVAQRAIQREWTVSGDSGIALQVEGARSELGAAALSAVIPGAGQLYAGRTSGLFYAAVEVAGWIGWALFHRDADALRDEASALAGAPGDSSSAWSFDRWEQATGSDASTLRVLYDGDREAFYDIIGSDEMYATGWNTSESRTHFGGLRERSNGRLESARWVGAGLWINHLAAAVDALRAARLTNVDLELAGDVELKARGQWRRGKPGFVVSLERRF